MPSKRKKRAIETVRKRESRGRIYLATIVIIVIAVAIGWYVYSSSRSANTPDFIIATPTGVTIHTGSQTKSTVNVTAVNQLTGTVLLSVTSPTGLTATISPSNVTGSGTATLTMSATTNGTYTVTVTGTGGGLTHSVTPRVATPVYATLVTPNGTMQVELHQAQAPKTVSNFVNLASSGFYSNLVWHRIVKGFVIQTGDPNTRNGGGDRSTWGTGGSSQTVPLEIDSTLHNNVGYLGMARSSDPNSGSSQFYINLANNNNSLDGQYTVFGKVISGMDSSFAIGNVLVNAQNQPIDPVYLTSVTISSSP